MPLPKGPKHPIQVVTACMREDGLADFALTQVEVTQEEAENGIHFYLVEAELLEAGYQEPFVHFASEEAPAFLLPAVQQYLASRTRQPAPHAAR